MKALNCNITPGFPDASATFQHWSSGQWLPVVLAFDPNNPARCQVKFCGCETATGGGTLVTRARGSSDSLTRQNVPNETANGEEGASIELNAQGIDPFKIPAEDVRRFRGALWTARLSLPYGPRPGQADNIIATDYVESFSLTDRERMAVAYLDQRRYKHWACGPFLDAGYHGQYPAIDYRPDPDAYPRDVLQPLWNRGAYPVYFALPETDETITNGKIDWQKVNSWLTPIYRRASWQKTVRSVVLAWEPNDGAGGLIASNAEWIAALSWLRDVFPNAFRYIHMSSDWDAPAGERDSEIPGFTNGIAWSNVAPLIHGWILQTGGYAGGLHPFLENYRAYVLDLHERFTNRSRYLDWPKGSAHGADIPLDIIDGERCSYWDYWQNRPESEAIQIGATIDALGVTAGYFDGGPGGS